MLKILFYTRTIMQLKTKPVWEMTEEEFEILLRPAVENAREKRFSRGLPISYRDKTLCKADNQFIHEYADGSKFLVELNMETREYNTLCKLDG
jgi:hypothetical protein